MSTAEFLPGSDAYYASAMQRREEEKPKTKNGRLIARANDVNLFDVLEDFFELFLPRDGESYKTNCPFGQEHEDGGKLDKGWRTYPASNSSFCFPMHGFMPPVRLVSLRYNERAVKAAERILNKYDLLRPKHYNHRMRELLAEREAMEQSSGIGNPQHAVEALNRALDQIPDYPKRQFDNDVMDALGVVLSALDRVVKEGDRSRLREWYMKSLSALTQIIERKRS